MIVVLSVPHTGTRFTCSYLDYLHVNYAQYHTDISSINDLYFRSGNFRTGKQNKAVIPVRDPLLTFVSTYMRANNEPKERDILPALTSVVLGYDLLMQIQEWFDTEFLRLDCEDKNAELERIAKFADKEHDGGYKWRPVGNLSDKATDQSLVNAIMKEWPDNIIKMVERRLLDAREHYGYA